MKDKIHTREWLAITLVLGLIATLGAISRINSCAVKHKHRAVQTALAQGPLIEVTVAGAVDNPGVFYITPGTTLKEVLKAAHLSKDADRKQLNLKKVIYQSEKLQVPSKPTIKKKSTQRIRPAKKTG